MMHHKRKWFLTSVASVEELAKMLTQVTWTLCSGFYVEGHPDYLFLNDATHEDGASEYAVIRGRSEASEWIQVESITFSWCSISAAQGHIQAALAGDFNAHDFARPIDLRGRLDRPGKHRCHLCA